MLAHLRAGGDQALVQPGLVAAGGHSGCIALDDGFAICSPAFHAAIDNGQLFQAQRLERPVDACHRTKIGGIGAGGHHHGVRGGREAQRLHQRAQLADIGQLARVASRAAPRAIRRIQRTGNMAGRIELGIADIDDHRRGRSLLRSSQFGGREQWLRCHGTDTGPQQASGKNEGFHRCSPRECPHCLPLCLLIKPSLTMKDMTKRLYGNRLAGRRRCSRSEVRQPVTAACRHGRFPKSLSSDPCARRLLQSAAIVLLFTQAAAIGRRAALWILLSTKNSKPISTH